MTSQTKRLNKDRPYPEVLEILSSYVLMGLGIIKLPFHLFFGQEKVSPVGVVPL
jgi:hypothetical protein